METAVQQPPSYSGRDPCLEQAGPSGTKKACPSKRTVDNNRNKRRGSFGNAFDKTKRRRRNDIVLPTKFLLGGNITDPLNLKSLENEEVNRLANQTPVASPATGLGGGSERVEVIIPRNINDPLNLNGPEPVLKETPLKKNRRRRKRNMKRKADFQAENLQNTEGNNNSSRRDQLEANVEEKPNAASGASQGKQKNSQRFRFGNYNRYYGYRNASGSDSRLPLLKKKWFKDKVCLDIGCNVGHLTLTIARDLEPKQMIGLDIDPELIRMAKKNIRHYVHQRDTNGKWFPMSCPLTFGPITMSGVQAEFPQNVFFLSGNYVLENEEQLATQREEFDTITCFSTSKWIQLNFGDDGLKRAFRRVFKQLRPGGRFILEPQPLSSYHKFCSAEHRENFRKMTLKPEAFADYLVSEIGFSAYRVFGVGCHGSKGFQRPLYIFKKAKSKETDEKSGEKDSDPPKPSPAHECDTTTASI